MDEEKRGSVKALVWKLASVSEQKRTEALCELRILSKNDADSRRLIAEAHAVPLIAEALYSPVAVVQENAAATLVNISITSTDHIMSTQGVLDAISHALRNPASPKAEQCAAAAIFSLLSSESLRPIIGDKRDIVFGLLEIVKNQRSDPRSIKDALSALFGLALYPLNRAQLLELGSVQILVNLVKKNHSFGLIEDATAVIAQLAAWQESWEMFKTARAVEMLIGLLDNSSISTYRTKENSVSALLNLARFGGEEAEKEVRDGVEGRALDGLFEVVHNGSDKGKRKSLALLTVVNGPTSTEPTEGTLDML